MKFNAAFITLAVLVASATAAPAALEERRFGMTTVKNGLSSAGQSISNGANKAGNAIGGAASAVGNSYNNNAATWNAGAGAAAGAAALAAGGITAETNNEKDDAPAQKRRLSFFKGSSGNKGSSSTPSGAAGAATGAAGATGASTADKIGSGTQAIGLAAGGLGIWNANEGLQQQQDAEQQQQQQRRSPLGPAAAPIAEVGLMGLGMTGGPSFSSSHSTGQSTGNGNVHVSGASSKRALQPRLFSFDDSSTTSQSTGNGNVHVSGASSGGGGGASSGSALLGDHDRAAGVLSQVAQQQQAQQKQQKRLLSFGHDETTTQNTGNGNVHVSGASSGGQLATPQGMAMLNPGTAGRA